MDYEAFKVQLSAMISDDMTTAQIIECLDVVAQSYSIQKKETSLSMIQGGIPEPLVMFLAAKAVEEKSKRTLKLYKSILSAFFIAMNKPITSISTNDIRVYLFNCRKNKHHANVTVSNTRRVLNGFFEWCVLEQIIQINPVKRIAAIKVDKSPRHAMKRIELQYLRDACSTPRDKALVDFLYSTGGRVSEICNAKISDIDWEKHAVIIRHGKGNVTRITYINPECEVSLRAYLSSRSDTSPYIFTRICGKTDKPLDSKTIQDAIKTIVKRANREFSVHITPHVFRHTVATIALHNGMPIEQVQKFLGHANINTTMIYAEVSDDDVSRSHLKYAT